MTIYEELSRIQKELKAPKNQRNNFGGYNYRSCEDILEAVKPLLDNCVLTVSDEVIVLDGRYYVKATACLALSKDEFVENTAYAREPESKRAWTKHRLPVQLLPMRENMPSTAFWLSTTPEMPTQLTLMTKALIIFQRGGSG